MDDLSAEDRQLIDDAIARGQVTRVPTGLSGIVDEDQRYNPDSGKIEFVDKSAAKVRARRSTSALYKRGPAPDPKVAKRRQKVAQMAQAGHTGPEIASALGISTSAAHADARKMGVRIQRKPNEAIAPAVRAAKSRHDPLVEKRRSEVKAAFDGKRTISEIAQITGINVRTVRDHLKALKLKAPKGVPGPKPQSDSRTSTTARREKIKALASEGKHIDEIAEAVGCSKATIYKDCSILGVSITPKPRKRVLTPGGGDKAAQKKERAAAKKVAAVRDRRRFKTVPVPMGDPAIKAPAGSEGTIFPGRVFEPDGSENLLKDGSNQAKIGGDVLVSWLKGARIYTLTLEERATCPTSCRHWLSCYGNSMPHSRRWKHGPDLMARLETEIADLCGRFERILLRLHVLGDFWSLEYVDFWERMLGQYPGLFIFGFTAHAPNTEIGQRIARVRQWHGSRFWMRHSDKTGQWGSFTLDFPTQQKTIGDAVVCPEQRDGMSGERKGVHCGNCGVCWSSSVPIAFVTH